MSKSDFPPVPKLLLEALEKSFPNTLPPLADTTLDQFRVLQGEQNVIRLLRIIYDKQTKNILE